MFIWPDSTPVVSDPNVIAVLGKVSPYRLSVGIEKPSAADLKKTLLEENRVTLSFHLAELFVGLVHMPQIENVSILCYHVKLLKF